jgi:uncharacterized protein (TIGR02300 family)
VERTFGQTGFDRPPLPVANDPTFENGVHAGSMTLVKADLGVKRICPSCSARFYDLQKRPIECPKCTFAFEPEALYKQRRPRQPEPAAPVVVRARDEEEADEEEVEEAEEAEAEEEEVEEEPVLVVASDDEEDAEAEETIEDAGMSVVEGEDAEIADIDVEDEGIEEEEEDAALLAEVEDEEDDVSGIIDADIKEDER